MKKHIFTLMVCALGILPTWAQEFVNINGTILPLSKVAKIRSSWQEHPNSLSLMMQRDESITLFTEALEATGWMDSLKCYRDKGYTVGADSTTWTNNALVISTATEYDNVAYMPQRLIGHTVLAETDSVLREKYGIGTLDGLKAKAKEIYDAVYPEDAGITDVTDKRNSLNRFVAYHILPFSAHYYQLTCVDGPNSTLAINWNRRKWDIADWYETCMPHSSMKFSFPSGTQAGLYVNRRGVQSRPDERGVFVRGAKVAMPEEMPYDAVINGYYFYIDDIVAYGENTQSVVFNERMRIDCSTLSPDFITSGARGHYTRSNYEGGKYGLWDSNSTPSNRQTCLGFKAGSAKNFQFSGATTHLHVRPRTLSFWSYQGDEVSIKGLYDVSVKLPPVPAGTYEVRLGTCTDFQNRGIVAFFIDGVPSDLVDMRPGGVTAFGWKSDTALGDEDAIASHDRSIHNKGWMKGPKSYYSASSESGGLQGTCFRDASNIVRKVIGHFYTDGRSDHYLRIKQLLSTYYSTMDFDYIELVPVTVYDDEDYAEDRW